MICTRDDFLNGPRANVPVRINLSVVYQFPRPGNTPPSTPRPEPPAPVRILEIQEEPLIEEPHLPQGVFAHHEHGAEDPVTPRVSVRSYSSMRYLPIFRRPGAVRRTGVRGDRGRRRSIPNRTRRCVRPAGRAGGPGPDLGFASMWRTMASIAPGRTVMSGFMMTTYRPCPADADVVPPANRDSPGATT